jgi:hypothetical protein
MAAILPASSRRDQVRRLNRVTPLTDDELEPWEYGAKTTGEWWVGPIRLDFHFRVPHGRYYADLARPAGILEGDAAAQRWVEGVRQDLRPLVADAEIYPSRRTPDPKMGGPGEGDVDLIGLIGIVNMHVSTIVTWASAAVLVRGLHKYLKERNGTDVDIGSGMALILATDVIDPDLQADLELAYVTPQVLPRGDPDFRRTVGYLVGFQDEERLYEVYVSRNGQTSGVTTRPNPAMAATTARRSTP